MVIDISLHHRIDFQIVKTCLLGCLDAIEYFIHRTPATCHLAKHRFIQAIQTDSDPAEASLFKRLGITR